MLKRIRVVLPVILVLTVLATGTGMVLANDSSTSQTTAVVRVDSQLINRLLALSDEATLDAALSRLVANETLNDQQSARIKAAWLKKQSKVVDSSIINRLLALKDEATLDAALSRLVANGTLNDQQSARIKAAWLKSR